MLLTPELVIADANLAFVQTARRSREELLGSNVFDAFPEDPSDGGATGVHKAIAALRRVLATGEADAMEFNKYDVEVSPGVFAKRYWSGVNAPVIDPGGSVVLIANCGEDVTDRLNRFMSVLQAEATYQGSG